ncbi:MAG: hypothetical protein QNI84_03580 [Henriciella sp.]|nr:hypothetical protein [Henriciella sp.]
MNPEFILPLLTAFGLGSIITAFIQSWLQNRSQTRKRNFEERKAAYIGLLEAYHEAAVSRSDKAAKNFAYWQMRCDLVAPPLVREAVAKIVETNDDVAARYEAHDRLKAALRDDLGVSKI